MLITVLQNPNDNITRTIGRLLALGDQPIPTIDRLARVNSSSNCTTFIGSLEGETYGIATLFVPHYRPGAAAYLRGVRVDTVHLPKAAQHLLATNLVRAALDRASRLKVSTVDVVCEKGQMQESELMSNLGLTRIHPGLYRWHAVELGPIS